MKELKYETINDIAEYNGTDFVVEKTIEELAELIVSLQKYKSYLSKEEIIEKEFEKTHNNLIDELADVTIMINQMGYHFGTNQIVKRIDYKIKRTLNKINAIEQNKNQTKLFDENSKK